MWYRWRAKILNFFVVCFVFWYFHFFWDIDVFMKTVLYFPIKSTTFRFFKFPKKIFFWKLQQKLIFLPERTFEILLVMFVFWSFEMRCEFFMLKISHIITNFIILWIKKFATLFKWWKHKHNQKDLKVLSGKNINFCWSFQKKNFFWKFEESECSTLYGKIKYDFHKHINISTKNENNIKQNILWKSSGS